MWKCFEPSTRQPVTTAHKRQQQGGVSTIATNSVAPISGSLLAQVEKLRGDAWGKQEFENLDPDVIESLIDILDQAKNVLVVLADEEARVQTNADLSDAGQIKAMTKAIKSARDKLQLVNKKSVERRQAYEQESIAIHSAPQPASEALPGAFREAEIREKWQGAPLHEQMRAYQNAAQNGWSATMRALKDAKVFGADPRLTAFIRRVDQERFEAKEPTRWARLKALKYSAEVLQALAMGFDFRLSGYGEMPSFSGNPTGKMDLGLQNTQASPKKSAHADTPPDNVPAFQ